MEQADADPEVGAILVSAAGRAFCAGGDMTGVPRVKSPFGNKSFVDDLDACTQGSGGSASRASPPCTALCSVPGSG